MEHIQQTLGEVRKVAHSVHWREHRRGEHGEHGEHQPLYGEQTKLTVENMSFSGKELNDYPEYIINAIKVKKACAIANYTVGNLDIGTFKAINAACNELINGRYPEQFPVDVFHGGGGIGINMNLNEVIAGMAGGKVDPIEHVNCSQSTSDVCHTAMRMTIDEMLKELLGEIDLMKDVLDAKAEEFKSVDTIARTCLQDGMRVSSGALFAATASAVSRRRKSLAEISGEMRSINLGWTVIGSGLGASDAYRSIIIDELRGVTGKEFTWSQNMYDAAEYPDDLADVSAEVRVIAEIMAKLARDLRLLSSGPEAGFKEIILPAVQKGSSFFPGKVNPVIPETMIQCSMLISGNDSVIQGCVGAGEIHLNLWEDMMGFLLMDNIRQLSRALVLFRENCIRGVKLDEENCRRYANSSMAQVVDMKEEYGYQALSKAVTREGAAEALEGLKEKGEL